MWPPASATPTKPGLGQQQRVTPCHRAVEANAPGAQHRHHHPGARATLNRIGGAPPGCGRSQPAPAATAQPDRGPSPCWARSPAPAWPASPWPWVKPAWPGGPGKELSLLEELQISWDNWRHHGRGRWCLGPLGRSGPGVVHKDYLRRIGEAANDENASRR